MSSVSLRDSQIISYSVQKYCRGYPATIRKYGKLSQRASCSRLICISLASSAWKRKEKYSKETIFAWNSNNTSACTIMYEVYFTSPQLHKFTKVPSRHSGGIVHPISSSTHQSIHPSNNRPATPHPGRIHNHPLIPPVYNRARPNQGNVPTARMH